MNPGHILSASWEIFTQLCIIRTVFLKYVIIMKPLLASKTVNIRNSRNVFQLNATPKAEVNYCYFNNNTI